MYSIRFMDKIYMWGLFGTKLGATILICYFCIFDYWI